MAFFIAEFRLLSVLTCVVTIYFQISTNYDNKNKVSCYTRAFSQCLLGGGEQCDPVTRLKRAGLGQQQEQPLALLGWLTACDVSHFRLDSTEHGAPPFFSPSPLSNPVSTCALAVASAMQSFATHTPIHSLT